MPRTHAHQTNKVFPTDRLRAHSVEEKKNVKTEKEKDEIMKKLLRIHQSSGTHWVGNGFPVRSVFDYNGLGRELSPFLLLNSAAWASSRSAEAAKLFNGKERRERKFTVVMSRAS